MGMAENTEGSNLHLIQNGNNDGVLQELEAYVTAIKRSQGVIEFNLDGTVLAANDNFLQLLGYSLDEIKGHHHRMFCRLTFSHSTPQSRQLEPEKLEKGLPWWQTK